MTSGRLQVGGGDNRAGGLEGKELKHKRGTLHLLAPPAVISSRRRASRANTSTVAWKSSSRLGIAWDGGGTPFLRAAAQDEELRLALLER